LVRWVDARPRGIHLPPKPPPPGPTPPPSILDAITRLVDKLREIKEPAKKLAVIDYWVGVLFDTRAEVQFDSLYQLYLPPK
jgi:hypothetical protein